MEVRASVVPPHIHSGNQGVRHGIRKQYILPAMDYSHPSDLEAGVVNSKPYRSKYALHLRKIVHAYAEVNSTFLGHMYTKFLGRQPTNGVPSRVRVVGPMPPGSTRSNRDALMKIVEERRQAAVAGISHWSDKC